jgi:hypothetical protein
VSGACNITEADLFRRSIEKLWGYGAQARAALHFEVTDRTIRHWVSGARSIPPGVMAELKAMVSIAPPPDGGDRDAACQDAIEPALTELRNRAIAAGWRPAEVAGALMALTAGARG